MMSAHEAELFSCLTHMCARGGLGNFHLLLKYFLKKLSSLAATCAQNLELHVQNLGSCLGNMQISVCCISDPYAISTPHTHVQLTFPSSLVNLAGRALADD